MELVYIEILLGDGRVSAWSSFRGKLACGDRHWRDVFDSVKPSGGSDPARVMIHFLGDDISVSDDERMRLMEMARGAGFGVVRVETGDRMEPEEAFELMTLPFT